MRRVAELAGAILLCGFHLGCADLHTISAGVCGNGVVEPARGEDCDGKGRDGAKCGAPGTAHACRLLCAEQDDCPTGFGCGVDGLCRASSGTWSGPAVVTRLTSEAPLDVMVADMDGDGKADVFAQMPDTITVDYDLTSSETGQTIQRDAILSVVGPVVDLSGDQRADAVVPTDLGFFVELGTETRTERATAYGAVPLPEGTGEVTAFTAELLPEVPGLENLVFATYGGMPGSDIIDISTLGKFAIIATLLEMPSDLAGPPRAGKFNEALPCQTLAFGFKEKTSVYLIVPCKASPQGTELVTDAPLTHLPLPRGATIAGPVTIADLDQDGHLDMLLTAARGSAFEVDVAYGRGDGTFASRPGSDPTTPADGSAGVALPAMTYPPLAVGDLDGDKQPDWVDTTGVYLSRGDETPYPIAHNDIDADWTSALIADLNGDVLPDVAITVNHTVAFLLNDGDSVFTGIPVTTPGPVSLMIPGDFDGDRVGDLAIVTNSTPAASGSSSDMLSVIFGSPFGVPAAPKEIGEFHSISQLVRGRAAAGQLNVVDGADELGALAEMDDGTPAFAIVFGRGDRKLRAPYDLAIANLNEGQLTAFAPVRIVPADIDGDGVTDLTSLGQNIDDQSNFRIWANPMQGEASIRLNKSSYSDDLTQDFDWNHVLMGALNLDAVPGDELVFLGPRADGSGYQSAVARGVLKAPDAPLTYVMRTPAKVTQTFTRTEQALPDPSVHNGRIRIADVDGDGMNDVVALGQQGKNGVVVVFFNDHTGELGGAVTVKGAEKLDVRDFAIAAAATDRKPSIVLLTATGVYDVVANRRDLSVGVAPALSMASGASPSPSVISAGDIDGDGVPDLALGGPLGYEVHLGISTNPLDAR